MVVGTTSEILVEDGRPGIKEVCHASEFRSFQCNHNTYGLCVGLVLSGKPHLGTNIWRLLARLDPEGRGATKESLAMVLSVKGLDHGLWVKCTNSREYCNLIDQPSSRKRTLEHLKDGASEGSSSLFSKTKF